MLEYVYDICSHCGHSRREHGEDHDAGNGFWDWVPGECTDCDYGCKSFVEPPAS